jgi:HPt (histidine-containing phosphotransfer) domain-containing protein
MAAIDEALGKRAAVLDHPREPHRHEMPDDAVVLDGAELKSVVRGNTSLLRDLTGLFLQESARQLLEIQGAADSADLGSVGRLAHTLKGAAASLSGKRVALVAEEMEALAKEGNLVSARNLIAALDGETRKLCEALASFAGRTAA